MPTPKKNETESSFVDRCIPIVLDEGKAENAEQATAMCHSMYKEKKPDKESRFALQGILETKETDTELIVKGYVATTHFDGQDIITKSALEKWAKEINEGCPRANKVSVNHNRQPHVAGVGIKGTAEVKQLPDGEYGLYVETLIDKTRDDYPDIKYRVENELLDSFSIEYYPPANIEFEAAKGARILSEDTELHGWTLASQPMNENAVMIKEILNPENDTENTELNTDDTENINNENKENKEDANMAEDEEVKMTPEQYQELLQAKEKLDSEKQEQEFKEKLVKFMEDPEIKEKIMPEQKVKVNKEDPEEKETKETPEMKQAKELGKEYKSIVDNKDIDVNVKFKEVGKIAEKAGLIWGKGDVLHYKGTSSEALESKESRFMANGTRMEYKGLGITSNQVTDTDYLLSAPELRDMFDPVIYDALNQSTTTFGLLNKDDFSNKGNNLVQFTMRVGANSTAGAYTGNSVNLGKQSRLQMQTKFKKYQAGVAVDGDMIAAAQGGPIGDVFGEEVQWATRDLISKLNEDLFAENGAEADAEIIGFEYICDTTGNTTLYNRTRTTDNYLHPDAAGDQYIDGGSARINLDNLRKAIEQAVIEGADRNQLFFVTHPTQTRLFKSIYDSLSRPVPMSSRFGFENMIEFDGIPIFEDKDCNSDDWFLIDKESHRIAIWVPPRLEMLGKRSDADEGFVKTYLATYNTTPRRMVMIHSNATS